MCEIDQGKCIQILVAIPDFVFDLSEEKYRGSFRPPPPNGALVNGHFTTDIESVNFHQNFYLAFAADVRPTRASGTALWIGSTS